MRTALTDGTGRWFDKSKAERFNEATTFNGTNHVSIATGSQFEHETLFRAPSGRWILHEWSQWQGAGESWDEITGAAAAKWLVANKHEPHTSVVADFASLEIK